MTPRERSLIHSARRRLLSTRDMPTKAGVIVQVDLAEAELRKALRLAWPDAGKNITDEKGGAA